MILRNELEKDLVIPGCGKPLTEMAVRGLFKRLEIKPRLKKHGNRVRAFITSQEAKAVIEEFKRIHRAKFKAMA